MKRVTAPDVVYSPTARLIALVIADRVDEDGVAFMGEADIAARAGSTTKTVQRHLPSLIDGDNPIFMRTFPGETKGIKHACARFTLIRKPVAFTKARDRKRKVKQTRVKAMLGEPGAGPLSPTDTDTRDDLRRQVLDLQRRYLDGDLKGNDAEYHRLRAEIEKPILKTVGGKDPRKRVP